LSHLKSASVEFVGSLDEQPSRRRAHYVIVSSNVLDDSSQSSRDAKRVTVSQSLTAAVSTATRCIGVISEVSMSSPIRLRRALHTAQLGDLLAKLQ
jgi:hypothetical protein